MDRIDAMFAGAWTTNIRKLADELPEGWTACLAMTEEGVVSWAAVAPGHFIVRRSVGEVVQLARETGLVRR